jgi:hypothetical protein
MRDDMDFDDETDGFLDPMSDPEWDYETFETDDFDESLYLDDSDRASAAKRRHTTSLARHRRENPKVIRGAPSLHLPQRSRKRVIRRAVQQSVKNHRPELERAFNRALTRINPDRHAVARAFPAFLHALIVNASMLASKKASSAITPVQIIQVPIFSVIAPALAITAKRFGLFPRKETQQAAEELYGMLTFSSLSIRLAAKLLGEGENFNAPETDKDYEILGGDAYDEPDGEEFEAYGDEELFREDEATRGGPVSRGERVAMSRALRNAARQLLRLERRLTARS